MQITWLLFISLGWQTRSIEVRFLKLFFYFSREKVLKMNFYPRFSSVRPSRCHVFHKNLCRLKACCWRNAHFYGIYERKPFFQMAAVGGTPWKGSLILPPLLAGLSSFSASLSTVAYSLEFSRSQGRIHPFYFFFFASKRMQIVVLVLRFRTCVNKNIFLPKHIFIFLPSRFFLSHVWIDFPAFVLEKSLWHFVFFSSD